MDSPRKFPLLYAPLVLGLVLALSWIRSSNQPPLPRNPEPALERRAGEQSIAKKDEAKTSAIVASPAASPMAAPSVPRGPLVTAAPLSNAAGTGNAAPVSAEKPLPRYVTRARPTELNIERLPSPASRVGLEDRLELFADTAVTVRWLKRDINGAKNYAWHGRLLEDPLSAVTLTRVADYSIIEVQSPKLGHYEVQAQDGHPAEVRQFDADAIQHSCGGGVVLAGFGTNGDPQAAASEEPALQTNNVALATPVTIDVLMVYTAKVREKLGSRSAVVAKAQSAVNGENGNFGRSGIDHKVRLVQTREVGHTASGNLADELGWVAGNSTVADVRSTAGADLVAFISDRDDYNILGIAQLLGSTGGNSSQVFTANYYDTLGGVWPHEAGHNLGCQHNSAGVYSYSSGHYWTDSSNGTQYGSIMSYIGQRIPYFSNPDISYSSEKTGTSTRNNAQSINNIGDNVAGYRTARTLIEPSCSVSTSATKPKEGTEFTITITSVNGGPSTATACKITVVLPSRLTLVSHNGGTAYNTSTKVWDVPDQGNDVTKKLTLTVKPNAGSAGTSNSVSASLTSIGSGFVDFDLYNNEGSVTIVPAAVPTDDLVLHYRLDETTGKIAADSSPESGTQNATTSFSAPLWEPTGGVVGGAVSFAATGEADSDQAFSYTSSAAILSGYPFTIAYWARGTSPNWVQTGAVVLDQTSSNTYYELAFDSSQHAQAIARNTSNTNVAATSTSLLRDNRWHHIVGVFLSSTSRSLYVDGVLAGTNTTSVPFASSLTRFAIGSLLRPTPAASYAGSLDDIGLWNIALPANRIALIHALGRYSAVDLDDAAIATLLAVQTAGSGSARAGDLLWMPTSGLSGPVGTSGLRNGQPYLVLNANGSGLIAVTKPELTVQRVSPGSLTVSWLAGFDEWILQESSDLTGESWTDFAGTVENDGTFSTVNYPLEELEQRFFRLRKP